jgi:hypothetical protein
MQGAPNQGPRMQGGGQRRRRGRGPGRGGSQVQDTPPRARGAARSAAGRRRARPDRAPDPRAAARQGLAALRRPHHRARDRPGRADRRGQRCLIVSPPKAGKTRILQIIAAAVAHNHPEVGIYALLVDERPEEVTDFKRNTPADVIAASSDMSVEEHIETAEHAMEVVAGQVLEGKDVVLLLDSITRLARAYNTGGEGRGARCRAVSTRPRCRRRARSSAPRARSRTADRSRSSAPR